MKAVKNLGYDPSTILEFKAGMAAANSNYLVDDADENTDEYVQFRFIGEYNGKEVIYDAAVYTLRLNHESELFEIAERRVVQHFPTYKKISFDDEDSGNAQPEDPLEEEIGLFMAEVILELEEEESIKVKEHIEVDEDVDFGVSLDVGLHVEKITPKIIEAFIKGFNEGSLNLDQTLYSFQTQGEAD
jgi:hypothetical protein